MAAPMASSVALLDLPHSDHAMMEVSRQLATYDVQIEQMTEVPAGPGVVAMILGPESVITKAQIDALPSLRIVATTSTGFDHVPVDTVTAHGAWVTNVPDYCTDEVADHCLALILGLLRGVVGADRAVHRGQWATLEFRPRRIAGMHLGLVGFGRTARALALRARALGMQVSTFSPTADLDGLERLQVRRFDQLPALLAAADVISLHVPLSDSTRRLIGRPELASMHRDAFLVNASRGELIDEPALAKALAEGVICGAAVDVLVHEPPATDDPLLALDQLVVTPHIAWESMESLQALYSRAARSVAAVLDGREPQDAIGRPAQRDPVPPPSPARKGTS